MILYDDACTPCVRKQEWRDLRNFVRINHLNLKRIDIRKQPEFRHEALKYAIDFPFVVHEGKAVSLSDDLRRLL